MTLEWWELDDADASAGEVDLDLDGALGASRTEEAELRLADGDGFLGGGEIDVDERLALITRLADDSQPDSQLKALAKELLEARRDRDAASAAAALAAQAEAVEPLTFETANEDDLRAMFAAQRTAEADEFERARLSTWLREARKELEARYGPDGARPYIQEALAEKRRQFDAYRVEIEAGDPLAQSPAYRAWATERYEAAVAAQFARETRLNASLDAELDGESAFEMLQRLTAEPV